MGNILSNISRKTSLNILDKAVENDFNITDYTIAFGCRSPESKGVGYWDGAYVYIQQNNITVAVVFQNNVDYISNELNFDEGLKIYNDFLKKEWIPMTNEDITQTSGFIINN